MTARRILARRAIARRALRLAVIAGTAAVMLLCVPFLIAKTFADARGDR